MKPENQRRAGAPTRAPASPESSPEAEAAEVRDRHRRYWRKNLRVTAVLMAIWFVVTFVVAFFARELSFDFFGWPFSFWVGAQGALVVYVLIIGYYAWTMNRLDREHGAAEEN